MHSSFSFPHVRIPILFLLPVILFVACEYLPENTLYREIASDEIQIEIGIDDINPEDIICIEERTTFVCRIRHEEKQTIHQAEVILGETSLIKAYDSDVIEFFIDTVPGVYRLKVECISKSGTKSIADVLGYENCTTEASWTIKVNEPDRLKIPDSGFRIQN